MSDEDRRIIAESTAEMRELKGEMRIFKEFILERIRRIEEQADGAKKNGFTIAGLAISLSILGFNIVMALIK